MAFEKQYPNRKDWRRPDRRVALSCRNHGGCPWCEGNRMHARRKADAMAREALRALVDDLAADSRRHELQSVD